VGLHLPVKVRSFYFQTCHLASIVVTLLELVKLDSNRCFYGG